jgi:Spy/CpxP family protein refolding chaperone
MSRQTVLWRLALLSVFALSSVAAPAEDRGRPRGGPPGPPPPHALDRVLGLSDEQQARFESLRKEEAEAARSILEEQRRLGDQIRQALDSERPDATAVGQKMIAMHAGGKKLKALRDETDEKRLALLDETQRQKFELLREMRSDGPERFELLRPMRREGSPRPGFGPPRH